MNDYNCKLPISRFVNENGSMFMKNIHASILFFGWISFDITINFC